MASTDKTPQRKSLELRCAREWADWAERRGGGNERNVARVLLAALARERELTEAIERADVDLAREHQTPEVKRARDVLHRAVLNSEEPRPRCDYCGDFNKGAKHVYEVVEEGMRELLNEVDCRIEHGAESFGHLDYVRARLRVLCDLFYEVNGGEER